MKKPVIGLALGSGAARGWAHIGILEVLEEEGIEAEIIAGTSIGAYVGAAYAANRLRDLHDWVLTLRWHDVVRLMDVSLNGSGLIGVGQVMRKLEELGVSGPIEKLPMPFAAVATDYATGREAWFDEGDVIEAIRASVALPGIVNPNQIDGVWYVDGGLVNPVPVSTCRAMGADFIIAVNLNSDLLGARNKPVKKEGHATAFGEMLERSMSPLPGTLKESVVKTVNDYFAPKPHKPGYFEILTNSIDIMQDKITRSRLAGEPPHVLISPRLGQLGIFDFDEAEAAIEEGRRCARHALPEIHHQLKHLSR